MYRHYLMIATTLTFWNLSMASGQAEKLYSPQPEHKLLE